MLFARIVLLIQIAALALLGLAYFIRPEEMASFSGALLMGNAAVTEVRAYYGGLQLGLATYLAMALLRLDLLRPALIMLVSLYSVLALARLAGLWLDGGTQQTFNLYALLLEAVSAALAWWALRGIQRET
ncbi:Uncharacterised protein [Ectopseudomonas mendocina]|jgi:hypothetical protein|uniref:DUF4345 domain-containing protein n=1 Tax=Ectopseudomonas mendocina TaxID=300 RepID=A0A379J0L8_ECTME|nr:MULTISPECIES: DUF4345 domain-containing protein [Pseudomonas]TRO36572.1 DUF4345 domain-containing protein [Pseudomonas sp. ALS1131]SUD41603.1 Uncharacterised protein [Pseudomonas mendocina]